MIVYFILCYRVGEGEGGRGEVLCVGTRSHFSLGSLWKGVGLALGVHVQKGVWFKGKWFNCFLLASPTLVEQFHASEPIKFKSGIHNKDKTTQTPRVCPNNRWRPIIHRKPMTSRSPKAPLPRRACSDATKSTKTRNPPNPHSQALSFSPKCSTCLAPPHPQPQMVFDKCSRERRPSSLTPAPSALPPCLATTGLVAVSSP